jgi:hypothetical protein
LVRPHDSILDLDPGGKSNAYPCKSGNKTPIMIPYRCAEGFSTHFLPDGTQTYPNFVGFQTLYRNLTATQKNTEQYLKLNLSVEEQAVPILKKLSEKSTSFTV